MKTISAVYKVVREVNNRFWSVNPSYNILVDNGDDLLNSPDSEVCEYVIDKPTLPKANRPLLFVCENFTEAQNTFDFFERIKRNTDTGKIRILLGWGYNVRSYAPTEIKPYAYKSGQYEKGLFSPFFAPPDDEFKSSLCDWFAPTQVIV